MRLLIVAALLLTFHSPVLAATAAPAVSAAPTSESRAAAPLKLDVNRAGIAELVAVPGLGERLAQAIVELRGKRGPFTKIEDLLEVRGIGEKNLAILSEHLMVAQQSSQAPATAQPTARQ